MSAPDARAPDVPRRAGAPSPPIDAAPVRERLAALRQRIEHGAGGRRVAVVAVTKGFGAQAVDAAIGAGLSEVGENYASELVTKAASGAGGADVRWHFIGGLQRNKIPALAPYVWLWQSVDRPRVAHGIADHVPGAAVLVQVNLTGEPRRSGCAWADVPALVEAARASGLDVRGLMGVGPGGPPESARPAFAALASLAGGLALPEVSMGMSGDLDVAVQEGSTMVRIGTALFGERPRPSDQRR